MPPKTKTPPAPSPADEDFIVEVELPPSGPDAATLAQRVADLRAAIAADEAEQRGIEEQHGLAMTLVDAEPLERQLAVVTARLRRTRGELVGAERDLAEAERTARDAARGPLLQRLHVLADQDLGRAIRAYREALEAAGERSRALVEVLHQIGTAAQAAGHPRATEVAHPTVAQFAAGAAGRVELIYAALGVLYGVSPHVLDTRKLMTLDALDRLSVDVRSVVRAEVTL